MSRLRKLIFLIFAAVYLMVAPLTVLYALGYIFNPVQQTLQQTGLITLNSEPSRASVQVNGAMVKEKTPLVLGNLKPGFYDIRIALPGRHSWHRQVEVKPDRVFRFENIFLFPQTFEPEVLGDFPVKKMWAAPNGKRLVVLLGDGASQLYLFEPEEKKFRPFFQGANYDEVKVKEVTLHPGGDRALVILKNQKALQPMLVQFEIPFKVTDVTDLLRPPFSHLQWNPHKRSPLYYKKGETLRLVNLDQGLPDASLVKRVRGYALHGRRLFVLDGRKRFLELTEKGKKIDVLLNDPAQARFIFGPDQTDDYSVFFTPKGSLFSLLENPLVLFLSNKGKLLSNKLPYFLDERVDELVLAESHPRLVYRKGKEIWSLDFESEQKKSFFESGPTPRRIYSGRKSLENLHLFYNDGYVLFTEGHSLMIQDFEGEAGPIRLLEISDRMRQVVLDTRRGFLYFAHPQTGALTRIKLFEAGLLPRMVVDLVGAAEE